MNTVKELTQITLRKCHLRQETKLYTEYSSDNINPYFGLHKNV